MASKFCKMEQQITIYSSMFERRIRYVSVSKAVYFGPISGIKFVDKLALSIWMKKIVVYEPISGEAYLETLRAREIN